MDTHTQSKTPRQVKPQKKELNQYKVNLITNRQRIHRKKEKLYFVFFLSLDLKKNVCNQLNKFLNQSGKLMVEATKTKKKNVFLFFPFQST